MPLVSSPPDFSGRHRTHPFKHGIYPDGFIAFNIAEIGSRETLPIISSIYLIYLIYLGIQTIHDTA
jgi:hypothetical protein